MCVCACVCVRVCVCVRACGRVRACVRLRERKKLTGQGRGRSRVGPSSGYTCMCIQGSFRPSRSAMRSQGCGGGQRMWGRATPPSQTRQQLIPFRGRASELGGRWAQRAPMHPTFTLSRPQHSSGVSISQRRRCLGHSTEQTKAGDVHEDKRMRCMDFPLSQSV